MSRKRLGEGLTSGVKAFAYTQSKWRSVTTEPPQPRSRTKRDASGMPHAANVRFKAKRRMMRRDRRRNLG